MTAIAFIVILCLILSIIFCILEKFFQEEPEKFLRIKKTVYSVFVAVVGVVSIVNSFFTTTEQEVAFTMTFGHTAQVETSGIHFKIPYITQAFKEDGTTKGMAIGYDPETNENILEESLMITSDFNFVNTDFYIEYRISDPVEYRFGSNDPEGILKNIAQAAIRNTVGLYTVDNVITTGKGEIESVVKSDIIEELERHHTGLMIVNVTIQDAEPPTAKVSAAFKNVENAKQNADSAINGAKSYESEQIPKAEGEVDGILKGAEAAKTEKINQANQEVAEFNALYAQYVQNPETVRKQLYFSTMEEILPSMEIIVGNDSNVIYIKNNQQTSTSETAQ